MLGRLRARMRERYKLARARETRYLMSFNVPTLNSRLAVLFSVFVTLNALDVFTTLLAIRAGPSFVELNPIASSLFGLSFSGFLLALMLKFAPLVPLSYATFVKESPNRPMAFRVVKVSALIALAAADIFYIFVVGSNVKTLAAFYLA